MKAVGDGSALAAYAWLTRAVEPGHRDLWVYLKTFGAIDVARELHAGAAPAQLQALVGRRAAIDHAMDDLDAARRLGARLVTPADDEWPQARAVTMQHAMAAGAERVVPPYALWVRGHELAPLLEKAVAIVGARACSDYGRYVTTQIAGGCAERGYTIVSGGALGIDGFAHRAALAADGRTVAVLAGGVDKLYPAEHARLLCQVADSGAIITEYPPGSENYKHRFLTRNRLVAGLSLGTVVVEAGRRSGARATAARCRDADLPLMVVPGPVTAAGSQGCLQLLREEGTIPVGDASHVIEAIGRIGVDTAAPIRGPDTELDALDQTTARILDTLPRRGGRGVDEIAVRAACSTAVVTAALTQLEIAGLATRADGTGEWSRSPGPGRR